MNDKEDSMELLDWDKKNIVQFAQYLYDLAKERVQVDRAVTSEEIVEEVTEKQVLELDVVEDESVTELVEEEQVIEQRSELDIIEEEIEESLPDVEVETESETEPEEILEKREDKIHLDRELQEVTIGLAKAVSGEEVGIVDDTQQEEIQEIIEKEHIPLPTESKGIELERDEESVVTSEILESVSQAEQHEVSEEQISSLDTVDLSSPIVKEPVINEEVLIQPENIPEDIHNLVFVEEATSVPITKEEIIITTTEGSDDDSDDDTGHGTLMSSIITAETAETQSIESISVLDTSEREPTESMFDESSVDQIYEEITPETTDIPEVVPEEVSEVVPEEISEVVPEPPADATLTVDKLDTETSQRRQAIIEQMLAETKKREEKEGFKVRELGETAGRSYSAVVFGNESNKNVKKWKKWEKKRQRQKKKK